jgi:Ni,Fe-hydrogenase I cytochrome b subunit
MPVAYRCLVLWFPLYHTSQYILQWIPFWPCSILMTTPSVFPEKKFNIHNMLWQYVEHLKISIVTVYWNFLHKTYVLCAKDTCVTCEKVDRFLSLFQILIGFVFVTIFLIRLGLCCDSYSLSHKICVLWVTCNYCVTLKRNS